MVTRPDAWFASRWAKAVDPVVALGAAQESAPEDQPRVIFMEAFATRAKLNDMTPGRNGKPIGLVQRLLDLARRRADLILIENANRGKDTLDEIRRQVHVDDVNVQRFNTKEHGSKVNRMWSVQPLFAQGLVYSPAHLVPATDRFGNPTVDVQEFQWVNAVVDQCQRTPKGSKIWGTLSRWGLIYLRKNGFFTTDGRIY